MARHLTQLTNPIKNYLQSRFVSKFSQKIDLQTLNAPLQVAQLKGEALFTQRFFAYLESKQINDEASQFKVWQYITQNSSALIQVVENSGLPEFFLLDNSCDHYANQCLSAYCICLWDAQSNHNPLAQQMVEKLVDHFLPALLSTTNKKKLNPNEQKRRIVSLIAKQWQIKPQIKESFTTEQQGVTFSLLAKAPKHPPVTLLTITGKRLNNTREKAYRMVLVLLAESVPALPTENKPVQGSPIKPFTE